MSARLARALEFAEYGFRLVMVHSVQPSGGCTCGSKTCKKGKHPIAKEWQKASSTDEYVVRDAFASYAARLKQEPNVGVQLGDVGGRYLISVDIDDDARYRHVAEQLGELPPTMEGPTPRGKHLFYSWPAGVPCDALTNIGGLTLHDEARTPGIDVKCEGGQVLVLGKNEHGEYGGVDLTTPVAELPMAWAIAMVPAPKLPPKALTYTPATLKSDAKARRRHENYFNTALDNICSMLSRVGDGMRHTTHLSQSVNVFALANGLSLPGAWDLARRQLQSAGEASGMPRSEVAKIISDAEAWVIKNNLMRFPAPTLRGMEGGARSDDEAERVAVQRQPEQKPRESWEEGLSRHKGEVDESTFNAAHILRSHPELAGKLSYDTMSGIINVASCGPFLHEGEWLDVDLSRLEMWLDSKCDVRFGVEALFRAVEAVARENEFHPVQQYLGGLAWDGKHRVLGFCQRYLGSHEPEAYLSAVSRVLFVGAVARAMQPGCKHDTMVILEGEEGLRKSSVFSVLGGKWHSDSAIAIGKPDGYAQIRTVWLQEFAELEDLKGARGTAVKAFLAAKVDRYRPPYARSSITSERGCAFVGTTNEEHYLPNDMGRHRRFLPVRCRKIDFECLARDRDQLWAEAMALYSAGSTWWLDEDDDETAAPTSAAREDRLEEAHPWTEDQQLLAMLARCPKVTTADVLVSVGVRAERRDNTAAKTAANVLKHLGYVAKRSNGKRWYEKAQ